MRAIDTLLPFRSRPANDCSVTGTVILRLGNPAVRMLETAGSANWRFHPIPDLEIVSISGRNRPEPQKRNPAERQSVVDWELD
jgi:hypothetical protein